MEDNKEILLKAGKEAEEMIENSGKENLKNPTYFWNLKKRILREKYNIDWQTPQEKNPNIYFD